MSDRKTLPAGVAPKIQEMDLIRHETAQRLKQIGNELRVIFSALDGKYNPRFTADPQLTSIDVIDFLNHLRSEIEAMTDGRPQPLIYCEETEFFGDEISARSLGIEASSNRWAECWEPGYEEVASVGNTYMSISQLKSLREWLGQVISWHESHQIQPLSKMKTFAAGGEQ